MSTFKFAYSAGHWLYNPNGIPTGLGLGDIREWTLNDQVADFIPEAAAQYPDMELMRVDDPQGLTRIEIIDRCAAVNRWGADYYLDIHHNAGINGGTGGGVVIYSWPDAPVSRQYRDAIYDAILARGGLRGDRVSPKQEKRYDSLRYSDMAAGLLECGFMDSRTDAPVIVTREYSRKIAYGIVDGIAQVAGLQRKDEQTVPETPAAPETPKSVEDLAREVISGKWDAGQRRKALLTQAGYDYEAVQSRVNAILLGGSQTPDTDTLAREVIAGKWDNGAARKQKLTAAGYDYEAVQARVNALLSSR